MLCGRIVHPVRPRIVLLDIAEYGQEIDQVALSSEHAIVLLRVHLLGGGFGIRLY
jgi:hypothetical protein